MQECRLAATDLACRRGDRVLFGALSFKLEPGQTLQVAGANGVGKSSLLRLMAGLLAPLSGTVERVGQIGLIDERPALDPHLPLGRALGFWAGLDGCVDRRLDRIGLASLLDIPVRYLSTGQRKRAAFARLLGQHAPIWLLDEPLNGLDTSGVALTEGLIAEHLGAGGICVIASHQPITVPGLRRIDLADHVA